MGTLRRRRTFGRGTLAVAITSGFALLFCAVSPSPASARSVSPQTLGVTREWRSTDSEAACTQEGVIERQLADWILSQHGGARHMLGDHPPRCDAGSVRTESQTLGVTREARSTDSGTTCTQEAVIQMLLANWILSQHGGARHMLGDPPPPCENGSVLTVALTTPAPTPPSAPVPTPAPTVEAPPAPQVTTAVALATAPKPAPAPSSAPGYGCAAALAYLATHAAPGYTFVCPGYAYGHEAMTCDDVPTVCPGELEIVIADPCPVAYMNEASNSLVLAHLSSAPVDPYGEGCGDDS